MFGCLLHLICYRLELLLLCFRVQVLPNHSSIPQPQNECTDLTDPDFARSRKTSSVKADLLSYLIQHLRARATLTSSPQMFMTGHSYT